MASKLETLISGYLDIYLEQFNLEYETEVQAGFGARYDFLIPLEVPIVIEADGIQHEKPNEFFFKTVDNFQKYKANDNFKNHQADAGEIYMIRISDENLTYEDFEKIMREYEPLLKEGVSKNHAAKKEEQNLYENKRRDFNQSQKEKAKAYRAEQYKKFKEQRRASKKS